MRRLLPIVAVAAGTLAAVTAVMPRLVARAERASFLSPDDPTVALGREVTNEFGFADPVVWVLEARDGDLWTTARLRRLAALTEDVLRIPGVVALDVVGLASPNMRDLRVTDDGIEPTYLMGDVPESPAALAALRRRIDTDPSYAGTLVSRDGRAAMVVANFRADADMGAVGAAAIALRDRYRDADTTAWTTGAPVLAATAPAAFASLLPRVAMTALVALVPFVGALGLRAAGAALLGAALAVAWTTVGVVLAGLALPWAPEAALPAALLAAVIAVGAQRPLLVAVILAGAGLAGAGVAGRPAATLWLATAAAAPVAAAAGVLARGRAPAVPGRIVGAPLARSIAALLALGAAVGAARLELSLGLVGYGERYLPPTAAADVAAVRRLFPPPTSLAFRVRGEPGFVTAPAVLRALDAAAAAARSDPAVRSATSIADVVKLVNAAFNGGHPQHLVVPDDRTVAGRHLAFAYSPPLRRFVDRAFAATALWVLVDGDHAGDLSRVVSRVDAALAAEPIPGGTVDAPAGDGALVLQMASTARGVAAGAALALLLVAGAAGAVRGRRAALRALAAGAVATGVGAGVIGWTWGVVDLVSLPLVAAAAVAAASVLAGGTDAMLRFALGLGGAGLVAAASGLPAGPLLAALLLGPALALLVAGRADTARPAPQRPERPPQYHHHQSSPNPSMSRSSPNQR